ncbi:MAG: hypothetical protein ACPGQS_08570 [Bradymonadia bacterium]
MSFSPPRLTDEWIEFQSKTQLEWFIKNELPNDRLTVIGLDQNELFLELTVTVRLKSEVLGTLKVMPVHRDSDVLGLHILVNNLPNLVPNSSAQSQSETEKNEQSTREGGLRTKTSSDRVDTTPLTRASSEISESSDCGRVVSPKRSTDPKKHPEPVDANEEMYGGLLSGEIPESAFDSGQAIDETQPSTKPMSNPESTDIASAGRGEALDVDEGIYRLTNLFYPFDRTTLIGYLVQAQIRCEVRELTLKVGQELVVLNTDLQGQLAISESNLDVLKGMCASLNQAAVAKGSAQQTLQAGIVEGLTTLACKEGVQFRCVRNVEASKHTLRLPFTVYITQVLHRLLKQSRLDEFKNYYQARHLHYLNPNPKALVRVQDFALDRKGARFFELIQNEEHDLRMLLKVSPVSNGETYRLLRMGELLGFITFNQERQVKVDLSDEHLSTLKAQFARSKDSHFDALGAHMVTHPKHYKANLAQMTDEFGVESIYGTHSFRHRELCAQIVRLATESMAFLTDRKRRVTYRQERFDKTMLRQAADVLLEKADMNRLRGDLEAMREALEMALELDPVLTRAHIQNQKTETTGETDGST